MILSAFPNFNDNIQLRMGYYLWRALIRDDPDKAIWLRVLKDLKPIANKGYKDPIYRPHYNSFLKLKGITWPQ